MPWGDRGGLRGGRLSETPLRIGILAGFPHKWPASPQCLGGTEGGCAAGVSARRPYGLEFWRVFRKWPASPNSLGGPRGVALRASQRDAPTDWNFGGFSASGQPPPNALGGPRGVALWGGRLSETPLRIGILAGFPQVASLPPMPWGDRGGLRCGRLSETPLRIGILADFPQVASLPPPPMPGGAEGGCAAGVSARRPYGLEFWRVFRKWPASPQCLGGTEGGCAAGVSARRPYKN